MTDISAGHELEYDAESDEYWCDECDRAFGGTPDHEAFLAARTPEQQARDMLERIGVENAQNFSSGDLVELANLIAQSRIGGRYNSILRRHYPEIFAARSPAPSDGYLSPELEREYQSIVASHYEDISPAAPSVEARDATLLGYPLRVDSSIPADEIRFVQNGQIVGVIRLAPASLLPPETP